MSNLIADVCNQALDAVGASDFVIGDIEEGSKQAQILLRAWGPCLRQLLRGANWDFARRQVPLQLLADSSGQTADVGSLVPHGQFQYEYAYPGDCAKVRFIPWKLFENTAIPAGNIAIPQNIPLTTGGMGQPNNAHRLRPAKFVISNDPNYPPDPGLASWQVQGVSPQGRTVILTNVQNADCIYTVIVLYPSVWDQLFRAAMIAYLASEIALPIWSMRKDPKFGLTMRRDALAIMKAKVMEARMADGNEGISTSDISVDWMRARRSGGWGSGRNGWGGDWDGGGGGWCGYDGIALADGAVF